MKSASNLVFGLLAGAAIGAIAGILFAPEKGSDTRKKLMEGAGEAGDSLKNSFNDFVDNVKEKFRDAKTEVEDVAEKGASKYNSLSHQEKNALS